MFPTGVLDSWAASPSSSDAFQVASGVYRYWRASAEDVPPGLPTAVLDAWAGQIYLAVVDTAAKAAYLVWRPVRSDPPQPYIRWALRTSSEGWTAGPTAPSTVVSTDPAGWLVGSGTGRADVSSPRISSSWALQDRTTADRLSVTVRADGPEGVRVVVSMCWLPAGWKSPAVVDSFAWTVPSGIEVDLDTSFTCRGAVPDDVLDRVHSIRVRAIAPTSNTPITLRVRDVRQAASTKPYGPDAYGIAKAFHATAPPGLPDPAPADPYQTSVLNKLTNVANWASLNQRAIHIGEWAWPKESAGDVPFASASQNSYAQMAEQWMRLIDKLAIPYTTWGESAYWSGVDKADGTANYGSYPDANYYCGGLKYERPSSGLPRVVNRMKPSAVVLERHMNRVPDVVPSVNLVCMSLTYLPNGLQYSSTNIGRRGIDYYTENPATIDYLYSRGYRMFRLPFRWDRVMRTPEDDVLDPVEWPYVKASIDYILSLPGTSVIVDQHSSAKFWISPTPADLKVPAVKHVVDGPTKRITTAHYVHFWNLISDALRAQTDRLIYEITNEPVDTSPLLVKRYTQAVVSSLRARGDSTFMLIPSFPYDNITSAFTEGNQPYPWIVDPAGSRRHAYTIHHYMDWDQSGAYKLSYAATLAKYPATPSDPSTTAPAPVSPSPTPTGSAPSPTPSSPSPTSPPSGGGVASPPGGFPKGSLTIPD